MATKLAHHPIASASDELTWPSVSATVASSAPTAPVMVIDEALRVHACQLVPAHPVVLVRQAAIAVAARLGDTLLRVLDPRPDYEAVIKHRPATEMARPHVVAVPDHVWREALQLGNRPLVSTSGP